MHAGQRIARPARDDRRPVGEARHPRETRDLLHRLREAGPLAPRAIEAEGGHAYQHQAWVLAREVLVAETEVVEDPGGEVLDHGVRLRDQHLREREPARPGEIERDAALAGVDAVIHRRPLPPAVGGRLLRARETDAVRALDRLDLDDIGAEDGEEVAHERARPEHREVEHAKPGERQGAAVAG